MLKKLFLFTCFLFVVTMSAQYEISIEAELKPETKSIQINQQIVFKNTSNIAWQDVFLNDWANSFSSKTTPLQQFFSF